MGTREVCVKEAFCGPRCPTLTGLTIGSLV